MFWIKALSYLCGVVSTIILAQEAQKYLNVDISLGILPAASAYSKNAFHLIHSLVEREAVNEDVAVFETLFVNVANASRPNGIAYLTSPLPNTTHSSEELPVVDQVTHTTKDNGGASYPKSPGWPSQCYPRYMTAVMIRFWLPLLLHIAHVLRLIFERLSTLIWDPPIFDEFKRSVRMDGWGFPSLAFSSPTASRETPGTVLNSPALNDLETKHKKGLADVQSKWNKDLVQRTKEQATLIEEIKSNCATNVKAKDDEASGKAIECVRLTREISKLKEKHETELAYLQEKFHAANLEAQSYKDKAANIKIELEVARDALNKEVGRIFDSDAAKGELEKEIEEKDRVIEEKEKVIEKHLETIRLLDSTNATGTVAPVALKTIVDDSIDGATGEKGEDKEGEPSETHLGKLSAGAATFVPSQAASPSQGPAPRGGALPTGGPCPLSGEGPTPLPPPFHQNGFRGGGVPNLQNPPRQPNAAGQMFTPRQGRVSNQQRSQQRQPQQGFETPYPSSLSGVRGSMWSMS